MSRRIKRRIIIRPRQRKEPGEGFGAAMRRMILPVMFFAAAGIFGGSLWLWRVGWFETQYKSTVTAVLDVTSHAGFSVEEILVEGRNQTDRDNILSVLGVKKGSPILAFDPHEALHRLTAISWVKSGTVERRLPSTLYIKLNERLPIALWQNNRRFYLIDSDGHTLREAAATENLGLPLVVGPGAQNSAADLLSQLAAQQTIFSRTRAAVRVGNRRWDLHMNNGLVVKLPEEGMNTALDRLSRLAAEQNILDRSIVSVDLRLPDRLIVDTGQPVAPQKTPKVSVPRI